MPLPEGNWAEIAVDATAQAEAFVAGERAAGRTVYPPDDQIFRALEWTPLDEVRVVILGQDPYYRAGQAEGLSFSVPNSVPVPCSLWNIYKELYFDLGIPLARHGHLETWARRGVLLLNSVLTVGEGADGRRISHEGQGWEQVTDAIVGAVNARIAPSVFLLWGQRAQEKGAGLDTTRHRVLNTSHPSPRSAHQGFVGCRHFSQANTFLGERNLEPINWRLPNSGPYGIDPEDQNGS